MSTPQTEQRNTVSVRREEAGRVIGGALVEAVTLSNSHGISARILTLGATLQSLIAPDSKGALADIILGHDSALEYEASRNFLGATIGRYTNRIAGGQFSLDGETFQLDRNDGSDTLHSGAGGFDLALWRIVSIEDGDWAKVILDHVSPDGEGGFPGDVNTTISYSLAGEGDLTIEMSATTTKPTVIAMTNHALFNLAGDGAPQGAMLHRLMIAASAFTPVDAHCIPTGEVRTVAGTVFDFRNGRVLADGLRDGRDAQIAIGRGYDHNFALDKGLTEEPQLAATLEDPASGRRLDVLTTEPGLQLYTGNAYDGRTQGKGGKLYRMGDGVALEPQKFPDTPNQSHFPSARLDPGQRYSHKMIYRLSAVGAAATHFTTERGSDAKY